MRCLVLVLLLLLSAGCRTTRRPMAPSPGDVAEAEWGQALTQAVSPQGEVDWTWLSTHRGPLDRYVSWLGTPLVRPSGVRAKHAFWLNAYTALGLWLVLEERQPTSLQDLGSWGPGQAPGFFFWPSFQVGRDRVSLWDITHERVRLRNLDPRSHGGLTCPARHCPPIRPELYDRSRLVFQLEDQLRRWLRHPEKGLRVDEQGVVHMPPTLHEWRLDMQRWGGGATLCAWLQPYAEPEAREALRQAEQAGCAYEVRPWDWRLTPAAARRPSAPR